jgi:hypothetical protein
MHVGALEVAQAFVTLDGSTIRELAGRVSLRAEKPSLAEATVPPGGATAEHDHRDSEELYDGPLRPPCCCAPARSDDDTVLTGG